MFAEEILSLDFDDGSVRKMLEVYNLGFQTACRGNTVDFMQLEKVLAKISADDRERALLLAEFIKGFSDGFPDAPQ